MKRKLATASAVLGTALVLAASPADARWRHHGNRHHDNWGAGIAGFAAGAILGGALAAQPRYYGPPAYAYEADPADAYCFRRFKSYDPRSGTYLGYDGYRHPCP